MSAYASIRRADKAMSAEQINAALEKGFAGRLATVGPDGWPYAVPMLYVWHEGVLYFHGTNAAGHLRQCVTHGRKACFVMDKAGDVFAYGRYQCDTGLSYESVVVFGELDVIEDRDVGTWFFGKLFEKYQPDPKGRPVEVYPRLDKIVLYRMSVSRITGKATVLPEPQQQWPAADRTASPDWKPTP